MLVHAADTTAQKTFARPTDSAHSTRPVLPAYAVFVMALQESIPQLPTERQVQLFAALNTLNERDRELLLLWDAGLSYREIAEVTELSPGAVGTTLARARRRLVDAHGGMEKEHAARN